MKEALGPLWHVLWILLFVYIWWVLLGLGDKIAKRRRRRRAARVLRERVKESLAERLDRLPRL